jgi:DNA topoisomerase-1
MSKKYNLVIVESPGKIKKIQSFLGENYRVCASYGHIRDLASGNSGIDKTNGFIPKYIVSSDKKDVVSGLKKLADNAEIIYLAGDNDREGEAISWHVKEVLKQPESKFKRIVFTEITKKAIEEAIKNPVELDINLVNAQQARRVLDRLVGFDLSPLLWKKVKPNLSAGRVQSVALRIIVEKEKEIKDFKTTSDFKVVSRFNKDNQEFSGLLDTRFEKKEESKKFLESCKSSEFIVESVEKKPGKKTSPAPFTTSTLQQVASSKYGFSLNRIMSAAQSLYEGGHITYMRTDSVILSEDALNSIETEIKSKYGKEYSNRKTYKTKAKGAQEAHEAIRPVDFSKEHAGDSDDCRKIYNLIWKRTMASQMSDAQVERTTITTKVTNAKEKFITKGEVITFDGFLKLYSIEPNQGDEDEEGDSGLLPNLKIGDKLNFTEIKASQSFKKPPMRYSEANIVKKLEDLGIGRPSTYASIISTIQKREYVEIKDIESVEKTVDSLTLYNNGNLTEESKKESFGGEKKKMVPSEIGIMVTDYLVEHFKDVMDYGFTASVENDFDEIAKGNSIWNNVISNFYNPFQEKIKEASKEEGKISSKELGVHPENNKKIYAKFGKFGPMIQMGENTDEEKPKFVKIDKATGKDFNTITLEEAILLLKWPRELGNYNEKPVTVSKGKFGPYVKYESSFVSIPETYDPEKITFDECVELLKEKIKENNNRVIKEFKSKGISVLNGKYGPYINKGKNNYKIPEYKEAKELTLKDCEEIISGSKKKKKK